MGVLKDIYNILKFGKKTTTYKYAALLAVFDYISEFPSEPPRNNFHFIPIMHMARQCLRYYYPFSFSPVKQGTIAKDKNVKIMTLTRQFAGKISDIAEKNDDTEDHHPALEDAVKIRAAKEDGFAYINEWFDMPGPLPDFAIRTLKKIRKRILMQPLRYIHNVNDEKIQFFGLNCERVEFNSDYDVHRKAGMKTKFETGQSWIQLMESDDTHLILDDSVYEQLAEIRLWGRNFVIKEWAEYLAEYNGEGADFDMGRIFKMFDSIYRVSLERDNPLMARYRSLYEDIGFAAGFYSGDRLEMADAHVDHFLPWSLYPVNRFWNLVPVVPRVNGEKSDSLPEWNGSIAEKMKKHIDRCIEHADNPIISNDLRYYFRIVQKEKDFDIAKLQAGDAESLTSYVHTELERLQRIVPGRRFSYAKRG